MADIMASNQTERVLTLLDQGEADDAIRDQVSAALLRSMSAQSVKLDEIEKKLWSVEALNALIDTRHKNTCASCPAKQYVDHQTALAVATSPRPAPSTVHAAPAAKPKGWVEFLCSSESIRMFIIVVILIWAVIYLKAGTGAVEAVKGAAQSTLTGGMK